VGFENLVGLVVLEDVHLDEEDPAAAWVRRGEGRLPRPDGRERGTIARRGQGVVPEEDKLDVVPKELIDLLDGLALQPAARVSDDFWPGPDAAAREETAYA
jgi:hypothetical protein